jgi:hypothetical protein
MATLSAMTTEPGQRNAASWIDDGEKYAVIALAVKLDDGNDGGFGCCRRCHLPVLRRHARRCQREDHGQERRRAPGPRRRAPSLRTFSIVPFKPPLQTDDIGG